MVTVQSSQFGPPHQGRFRHRPLLLLAQNAIHFHGESLALLLLPHMDLRPHCAASIVQTASASLPRNNSLPHTPIEWQAERRLHVLVCVRDSFLFLYFPSLGSSIVELSPLGNESAAAAAAEDVEREWPRSTHILAMPHHTCALAVSFSEQAYLTLGFRNGGEGALRRRRRFLYALNP